MSGDYVVLLDLRRDQYLAVNANAARGLRAEVSGWPSSGSIAAVTEASSGRPTDVGSDTRRLFEQLRARGLLTAAVRNGIARGAVDVPCAETELCDDFCLLRVPVRVRDVLRVAAASLLSWLMIRVLPLRQVVSRVRRRKHDKSHCTSDEPAELRHHVRVFNRLRPFFFSARNACLLESLALVHYLAHRGFHPQWVFGVRTRPFAAHCWVQNGAAVCNDTAERVSRYTPIMSV